MSEFSTVYATRAELTKYSVPAAAIASIATGDQDDALRAASRTVDSYLCKRFVLPLSQWGEDVTQVTCDIAAYRILKRRGFSPQQADANQYRMAYDDAIRWLEGVTKGNITPTDCVDASQGAANATDATGEALQDRQPVVLQARDEAATEDGFWRPADCGPAGTGVGSPRRRGW